MQSVDVGPISGLRRAAGGAILLPFAEIRLLVCRAEDNGAGDGENTA